jgi:hypothetical protein
MAGALPSARHFADGLAAWRTACRKAGLWNEANKKPTKLFHDLRRTAVRNFVRSASSEAVTMKISGHLTSTIFRRYDITTESDQSDAVRRLDQYAQGKQARSNQPSAGRDGHARGDSVTREKVYPKVSPPA